MRQSRGLVDRYLQAVEFWLPKAQQEDIAAELAEDLVSKIEEQESGLGRRLNDVEIAAVLRQSGSPILVASRYLPQRSLIGPMLFPVYVFVLKMVALFYWLPWLLVLLGLAIFHEQSNTFTAVLLDGLGAFWKVVLTTVAGVTIAFSVIERSSAKTQYLEQWDPLKLPPVRTRDPWQIKRSTSIAEIIANAAVAFWWLNGQWFEMLLKPAGIHVVFAPVWRYFYWGILLVALANILLATFHCWRPYWTSPQASLRLTLDCVGAGLFCWLLKAYPLADLVGPHLSAAAAARLVMIINTNASRSFPFSVAASLLFVALADLPRILRPGERSPGRSRMARALPGG